mmetsp:Transcript_18829/g.61549  ORF Transcript_18829/g.61549 Transcript_18829/m.61549 type:complete len:255 (-) Transcript_18829:130-894(-)
MPLRAITPAVVSRSPPGPAGSPALPCQCPSLRSARAPMRLRRLRLRLSTRRCPRRRRWRSTMAAARRRRERSRPARFRSRTTAPLGCTHPHFRWSTTCSRATRSARCCPACRVCRRRFRRPAACSSFFRASPRFTSATRCSSGACWPARRGSACTSSNSTRFSTTRPNRARSPGRRLAASRSSWPPTSPSQPSPCLTSQSSSTSASRSCPTSTRAPTPTRCSSGAAPAHLPSSAPAAPAASRPGCACGSSQLHT